MSISSSVETKLARKEIESIIGSTMTHDNQRNEIGVILQKIFKKHGMEYALELIKELNLAFHFQINIAPDMFQNNE